MMVEHNRVLLGLVEKELLGLVEKEYFVKPNGPK